MTTFLASGASGLVRATSDGDWDIVLPGADVRALCVHPSERNLVYAGTDGHGVLRSADAGRTWDVIGPMWRRVRSLAASPCAPDMVIAGTKPCGIFISRDRGNTWTELEGFRSARRWWWRQPAERPSTPFVQSMAVSPIDPDVMLAGIEACALLRTDDGGRSWSRHLDGARRDCHSVVFHHREGAWAYQGAGGIAFRRGGATYSDDGGRTWKRPEVGLEHHYGWSAAADPEEADWWYVTLCQSPRAHRPGSAEGYVYRRRGGRSWERLAGGLPQPLTDFPYAVVTMPNRPDHVWLGVADGTVWESSDRGDTWERLPLRLPSIRRSLAVL